jgi:hypothetical protein
MQNKRINQLIIFFSLIIITFSCNKKDDNNSNACLSFNKAPVTKVEGATVALVNQEISLTVSFGCSNGCGEFVNFDEAVTGNTTSIAVNAKYEGCICTLDAPIRQTIYKFKRSQPGTYDLKFLQAENTYLVYTIVVQ